MRQIINDGLEVASVIHDNVHEDKGESNDKAVGSYPELYTTGLHNSIYAWDTVNA